VRPLGSFASSRRGKEDSGEEKVSLSLISDSLLSVKQFHFSMA